MKEKWMLAVAALAMVPALALAGFTQPAPVTIQFDPGGSGSGTASGDMLTARDSENAFEHIGCGIRAFDDGAGGAFYSGFCQARLAEDLNVVCQTFNKALLDGIQSIADYSFITFSWEDDGTGALTCTRIGSSTQSFYLPKTKSNL